MLKLHKQNLVPEADFHIREERVKAQKTEGEASTSAKPASTPAPPTAATEKTTKKEKEATREKGEKAAASKPEEKPPQKITKVKGALTATEARAAAEKEKKEQLASTKEKGEESKSPESASEAVAASATSELQQPSTPNPELPAASAARREAKTGGNGVAATSSSASKTAKTKTKEAVSSTATAENGGSNNHHQVKKSAKSMGKSTEEESGSGDSSSEKKTTSKGSGKADDKAPKGKPKSLLDKSDGAATPSSRGASPSNAPSPVMRGAKGTKKSPVVNQNGPTTTATPSPRAGQRRQLSENEVAETIPEKGEPLNFPFSPLPMQQTFVKIVLVFYYRIEETKNRRKSNGYPHKRLCCRYNHVFCCPFFADCFLCKEFLLFRLLCYVRMLLTTLVQNYSFFLSVLAVVCLATSSHLFVCSWPCDLKC